MNPEAVLAIGGVVGGACKFLMMSGKIRGPWATVAAIAITSLAYGVWGFAHGDFTREASWDYFVNWITTLTVAGGAFHGAEEAVKKAVSMGTGNGRDV